MDVLFKDKLKSTIIKLTYIGLLNRNTRLFYSLNNILYF